MASIDEDDNANAGPIVDTRSASAPFGVEDDAFDMSSATVEDFRSIDAADVLVVTLDEEADDDNDSDSKCNRASLRKRDATSSPPSP